MKACLYIKWYSKAFPQKSTIIENMKKINIGLFLVFAFLGLITSASATAHNGSVISIAWENKKEGTKIAPKTYLSQGIILKASAGSELLVSRKSGGGVYPSKTGTMSIKFVDPQNPKIKLVTKRNNCVLAVTVLKGVKKNGMRIQPYDTGGKMTSSVPIDDGGVIWMPVGTHAIKLDFNGNKKGEVYLSGIYYYRDTFGLPLLLQF